MLASRPSKVASFRGRRSRRAASVLLAASHVERLEQRTMLATISGTRYNDFNQNGIKDGTDVFVPGQIVYVDSGAPGYDGSAFSSSDIPKTIADVSTVTSNLVVGGMTGTISDVNVTLNISHTFDGDVDIFLISPTGTRIELSTDNGSSGDNYYFTTFDDEAATLITAGAVPYNGYFKPEGSLASVDGQNPNGTWKLECTDDASGIAGVLDSWSLQFNTTEISTTTDKNGAFSIVGLPAGTHTLREVNTLGWVYSQPASGQYSINLATASTVSTGNAFGAYLPPGNVRGRVWQDNNGDGTAQHVEPALAGWTVYLDANDNGTKDAGEASAITDGTGNYAFDNITPRTYVIRVQAPAGFAQTTPTGSGVVLRVGAGGGASGPNLSVVGTNKAGKYSLTEVVANLTGRRALSDLASYLRANPESPLNDMLDLGKSSRQILRTTNSTTMTQLQLKPGVDPIAAVEALKEIPNVKWASTNAIYDTAALGDPRELTPNDPQYASQYMHTRMQNNLAWDTTIGDSNMIVAVTDDGVDWNHQDLAAGIWNNTDEIPANGIDDDGNGYIDDTRGWDFWANDNNPIQISGDTHGNHTSGIVGARINNNVGVVGTSPGVQIMPVKFYGSSGNTWTATMVASSYAYAVDNGAKIISTSYNVDGFVNNLAFEAALNYVYSHGVLHFNSAGNNSQQNPARAKYDQSLYVASTNSADVKSSFSNYGWGVDISAPGENILSTYPNNTYQTISGTSMSTPNAAAVAALIWSAHPTWTRDQVAAQIIGTADNIDAANPTLINQLGGRANSFKGVNNTLTGPKLRSNGVVGLPAEGANITIVPGAFTIDVANVLDSTSANNVNNWTLKGDGPDNTFGTADDTNVPITLGTNIMLGTNRISFTIPNTGSLLADTYRFSITANVKDPFGNSFDGNGDGTAGDAYTRTFTLSAIASPYRVNLTSNQTVEAANFGEIPSAYTGSQFTLSLDSSGNNVQVWIDQPTSSAPTYTAAKSIFTSMTFTGGAGNDALTLDYRNGYPIPNSGLSFNGGGGTNDSLIVMGTAGTDTATFNNGLISMGGVVSYSNVESLSFDGNGGPDVINVNGGLNVTFPTSQTFASLTIANGGSASLVANAPITLTTGTLSIGATGKLDLGDFDLRATATALNTVRGYIATAYHFGDWLGAGGLFSSAARDNNAGNTTLGLMTGQEFADNNGGTFNGVTPAATDTLVKYTYFGDVDFNGSVDVSDYNLIDFGFTNHLTGWTNGDVDYSGGTDVSDYNLIDVAFASQLGVL